MNVGVRELRDGLSRHINAVRGGVEITVTDHGKAVARIVPLDAASGLEALLGAELARSVRRRAEDDGVGVERVVSRLVAAGLADQAVGAVDNVQFPVMSGDPSHAVTAALVAEYRDDV